jgi:hypothetical protein
MTLGDLRKAIESLSGQPDDLLLVNFDEDWRLRDSFVEFTLAGRDEKDKMSDHGEPVIVISATIQI